MQPDASPAGSDDVGRRSGGRMLHAAAHRGAVELVALHAANFLDQMPLKDQAAQEGNVLVRTNWKWRGVDFVQGGVDLRVVCFGVVEQAHGVSSQAPLRGLGRDSRANGQTGKSARQCDAHQPERRSGVSAPLSPSSFLIFSRFRYANPCVPGRERPKECSLAQNPGRIRSKMSLPDLPAQCPRNHYVD